MLGRTQFAESIYEGQIHGNPILREAPGRTRSRGSELRGEIRVNPPGERHLEIPHSGSQSSRSDIDLLSLDDHIIGTCK